MNESKLRPWIFTFVTLLHFILILFIVFETETMDIEGDEIARVMKLIDLDEFIPPPPEDNIPMVEAIAETIIETDTAPMQTVVAAGTLTTSTANTTASITSSDDDYLPMHLVSVPPQFDVNAIMASLVYPPIALRSGIEGRVILELFVDRTGMVQRILILREEPEDRGFGEAAVRAFTGRKGIPAMANGEPVSARYRYPLSFRIR